MAWNRIGNLAVLSLAFVFAACGEDSGSNGKTEIEESSQAETFDDLPNCSKNREGETIAVLDDRKTYICNNGRWEYLSEVPDTVKTEDDLSACLEKNEGKIAFISKNSTIWGCFDKRWEKLGTAYQEADDLPNCSDKREGNRAYIVADKESLICSNRKWENLSDQFQNKEDGSKDDVKSSSSEKRSLSSSIEKEFGVSSSSEMKSSSSKGLSSSEKHLSSSSVEKESSWSSSSELNNSSSRESSSSFAGEENCPAVLEGWNWDVSKECRFGTTVAYGIITETAERGGQTYRTVTIGAGKKEQTWMAENLNYYKASDSTLNGHSWCYGALNSENTANCAVTGRLYTWAAAMGKMEDECGGKKSCNLGDDRVQGICPDGWHLPKREEWELLIANVGGEANAGQALKSQTGWQNWDGVSYGNGTDVYGFAALPAGYRDFNNKDLSNNDFYNGAGDRADFWSSTEEEDYKGIPQGAHVGLVYSGSGVSSSGYSKDYAFSVRCVKD